MDTGESFGSGTVEIQPGESVLFGAVVSTDAQSFSSSIELEVDVPDTDGGSSGGGTGGSGSGGSTGGSNGGNSGTGGGGEDAGDEEEVDDDEPDNGGGDTSDEATEDGDGVVGEPDDDDDTAAGDDATDPSVDTDTDPGGDLIELAGFGTPFSLVAMSVLAVILSLSYAFRLGIVAGGLTSNTGGPE